MKFEYNIIESCDIDIDFEKIYEYIKEESLDYTIEDICTMFNENVEYYLQKLYLASDFSEEMNEYETESLREKWYDWLVTNKGLE